MQNKFSHYTGIVACILLIITCFLPWTYYNSFSEGFTGFNVRPFPNGTYYGRAGIIITIFTSVILILMLIRKKWGKRINLFLAAVLVAYSFRTYTVFTSSLFKGEVEKQIGIYLIIPLSVIILVCSVFPAGGTPARRPKVTS